MARSPLLSWPDSAAATAAPPAHRAGVARVAYVMNAFPRLSETFIAHEIHQLERLGLPMRLYAVKREDEPMRHAVVKAIRAPLLHLPAVSSLSGTSLPRWLRRNLGRFVADHADLALRHPLRWSSALGTALGLAWRHRSRDAAGRLRLRKVFIKEFLQAGAIAADVGRQGDIGHLHGHFCHGVATITWLAARMAGLPFSFTAHAKDIYQAELNPGRLLERKMDAARFVATCTCANADVLQKRHPRPCEVHAIYHGLDTDWFAPGAVATDSGSSGNGPDARSAPPLAGADLDPGSRPVGAPPLLLAVGRLVHKKGFDLLVDACAQLAARGIDFECRIVGESGAAGAELAEQIDRLGLQGRVQLAGAVTQDSLRAIYAQTAVFALPCRVMADGDRDGFPNVLAEAMAMGVPIVSTAISGIPEMVDDGVHGLLVPPDRADALADALARVLQDGALRQRLALGGRQRICERFDSRQTTRELHALFVDALAAGPRPQTQRPVMA